MTQPQTPKPQARRPLLTREAVVQAAERVLQRDGYGGLTMRAIADELRVKAPALYWYVSGKDQLEQLLYDHLMSGLAFTVTGDDWRDHVRQAARQLRLHLRSKRDIAQLTPRAYNVGPNSVRLLEDALSILHHAGLGPRDAAYGFNMLFGYVIDWASGEAAWAIRQQSMTQGDGGEIPDADSLAGLDPDEYPAIIAAAPHLTADDPDGRFEFGLNCMIAGLARLAVTPEPTYRKA